MQDGRIAQCFRKLAAEGRTGLVCFTSAGDPDPAASMAILAALPGAGADIVELGMPFSDPMAEGPSIQLASQRALRAGQTMAKTMEMARNFRALHSGVPLVLMGYYNPVYSMGVERFCLAAAEAGVDGLIIVDLPPEMDAELRLPAAAHGISLIRLATPTSTRQRLQTISSDATGFIYYVSMTGVTGVGAPDMAEARQYVAEVKKASGLPVAVGFGIRTPEQAAALAGAADAVVVGSVIADAIAAGDHAPAALTARVAALVTSLRRGLDGGQQA